MQFSRRRFVANTDLVDWGCKSHNPFFTRLQRAAAPNYAVVAQNLARAAACDERYFKPFHIEVSDRRQDQAIGEILERRHVGSNACTQRVKADFSSFLQC